MLHTGIGFILLHTMHHLLQFVWGREDYLVLLLAQKTVSRWP